MLFLTDQQILFPRSVYHLFALIFLSIPPKQLPAGPFVLAYPAAVWPPAVLQTAPKRIFYELPRLIGHDNHLLKDRSGFLLPEVWHAKRRFLIPAVTPSIFSLPCATSTFAWRIRTARNHIKGQVDFFTKAQQFK
jgi:hypothetical protein